MIILKVSKEILAILSPVVVWKKEGQIINFCSGWGNFQAVSRMFQLSLQDGYDKIEKRDEFKKELFRF